MGGDPNALRQALAMAIEALSSVADALDGGGDNPQAPGAPAPGAPAAAPAQKAPTPPGAPAPGGPAGGEEYLQHAQQNCPACGQPMPAAAKDAGDMSGAPRPMAMSADGDQGLPPVPSQTDGNRSGLATDGVPPAVIHDGGPSGPMRKASEPTGGDAYHPAVPQGNVPHDEGGSLGLGSPKNNNGQVAGTKADVSGSGVDGAVIHKSAGGLDPQQLAQMMEMVVSRQLKPLNERLDSLETPRSGKKSLAKAASAPQTDTELTFNDVLAGVLSGRLSVGDED